MTRSYKQHFSRFLSANPERLHFAAHSHHLWPDVTEAAHRRAWECARERVDDKWREEILAEVLPGVQRGIARELGLARPERLAFAPNTHEFLKRVVSALPPPESTGGPARILTTDAEFHSFQRQCDRWVEAGRVERTTIPAEPFETFDERFLAAGGGGDWDLVFCSHVFFTSGFVFRRALELAEVVAPATPIVLDGYHSFLALPVDLSGVEDRLFYLAGGYKYAMSGEGCCFLSCPAVYLERPVDTGWFASFGELEGSGAPGSDGRVGYGPDGWRFWGATFDPTPLFRLQAVLGLFEELGIGAAEVHAHVRSLQARFLDAVREERVPRLRIGDLVPGDGAPDRGHFLTFRRDDAAELYARLHELGVVTDHRGPNLRFGFGLYHDPDDVDALVGRMGGVL